MMRRMQTLPGPALPTVFGALGAGVRIGLTDHHVRRVMVASLLVNAAAFLLLFAGLVWGAFTLTAAWADGGFWLFETLAWVVRAAAVVGALFVAPVLFNLLAGVVLPLFQEPVFKAARRRAGGPDREPPGGVSATTGIVATSLRRLARFVGLSLLLLPLNLVPGVGSLAYVVLQFLLGAHTLAWDLMAFHFELHGVAYAEQKRFLRRNRAAMLALGSAALGLCLVPIAQLVFITTNVAGAGVLSAWMDGAPRQPPAG